MEPQDISQINTAPDLIALGAGNSFNVPEMLLWIIFVVALIVSGGAGIVLHYHWLKYGSGNATVVMSQILYTLVLAIALIVMFGSIVYYSP